MLITEDDIKEFIDDNYQLIPFCKKAIESLLDGMLKQEARDYISQFEGQTTLNGQKRVVLSGFSTRYLMTPVGPVNFNIPRIHHRNKLEDDTKFTPSMLPRFKRNSEELQDIIPFLYLKGISITDFFEAFKQLFGMNDQVMSARTIVSIIQSWTDDFKKWSQRDLVDEYPYVLADGIFFPIRGHQHDHKKFLTLIGINSEGKKELLALATGFAEKREEWQEIFLDLRERGLKSPRLVIGDADLGLWGPLKEVYPECRRQTCWNHKILKIQKYLPKSLYDKSSKDLKEIYHSESLSEAERKINIFAKQYEIKFPLAIKSLEKNKKRLLTFYNFPKEHWNVIRTTNIIDSIFESVLNPSNKISTHSINTLTTMVFKWVGVASKNLKKISSAELLGDIVKGWKFEDGMPEKKKN